MPDRSPDMPPDDPIKIRSFTFPLLIASILLILTVAWSFYVEFYGLQPWRRYQSRFARAYSEYLGKDIKQKKKEEGDVYSSPEYKQLAAKLASAQQTAKTQDDEIAKEIDLLDEQRAAMADAFKDERGKIGHLVYEYEIIPASDKNEKAKRLKELQEGRSSTWKVDWPTGDGKVENNKVFTADQLNDTFTSIMAAASRAGCKAWRNRQARERRAGRINEIRLGPSAGAELDVPGRFAALDGRFRRAHHSSQREPLGCFHQ